MSKVEVRFRVSAALIQQRGIIPARSWTYSLWIAYEGNMIPVFLRGRASIFSEGEAFVHFIEIVLKFIFKCVIKILSAPLHAICAEPYTARRSISQYNCRRLKVLVAYPSASERDILVSRLTTACGWSRRSRSWRGGTPAPRHARRLLADTSFSTSFTRRTSSLLLMLPSLWGHIIKFIDFIVSNC